MVGDELLKKLDEIGWFDEMPASERERFAEWTKKYGDSEVDLKGVGYIRELNTKWFEPDIGAIKWNVQKLADASWGMFAPTDITWDWKYGDPTLSFEQNGQIYWVIVPSGSHDYNPFYRFPPQILTPINQAIADAGFRSRYFLLPWFHECIWYFALVPKDAYQKAVQEGLIPEMPSSLSELVELLVRIHVDLPEVDEDDLTDGNDYNDNENFLMNDNESVWAKPRSESVWAKHIGDDLYEIRSVPLYAYNLHFDDVVKAVAESPDAEPKMLEVVRRSGYKTIRIKFRDEVSETDKGPKFSSLANLGAVLKNRDETRYGLYIQSEADFQWIHDETERKEIIEIDRQVKYQRFLEEFHNLNLIYDGVLEYELGEQDNENLYIWGGTVKELEFNYRLLDAARSNNNPSQEAEALSDIGYIYTAFNSFKQWLELREYTHDAAHPPVNSYDLLSNKQSELHFLNQLLKTTRETDNRKAEASVLHRLAFVTSQQGNREESLIQMEAAIDIIDSLRTQITSQEALLEYFKSLRGYYESYISLLKKFHRKHPSEGYDVKAQQAGERMNKMLVNE